VVFTDSHLLKKFGRFKIDEYLAELRDPYVLTSMELCTSLPDDDLSR
jgi:hypothetical protein